MSILWGFLTPFKAIGLYIDCVVFSLIDDVYNMFVTFATNEVISSDTVNSLINNIYILVGVLAFVKLAIFLVQALISPDKLYEKKNGLGNVLIRVVIMLCAIVLSPFIFKELGIIQGKIVNNNLITKAILPSSGKDIDSDNLESNFVNAGKTMQKIVITSLIRPEEKLFGNENSGIAERSMEVDYFLSYEFPDDSKNGPDFLKGAESDDLEAQTPTGDFYDKYGFVIREECRNKKKCLKALSQYHQMISQSADGGFKLRRLGGYIGGSLELPDEYNTESDGDTEDVYYYEYMLGLTTISGIFLTYVLLSWSIDIAVRSVELAVLRVLSPLFIATIVDPKSTASGGYFNNWLKRYGKTYADLFIKLAIISFAILAISLVQDADIWRTVTEGVISL